MLEDDFEEEEEKDEMEQDGLEEEVAREKVCVVLFSLLGILVFPF